MPHSTPQLRRVVALIDGFNLYHAIDDFCRRDHLKWVDLKSLVGAFVGAGETLTAVNFFTAFPPWNNEKRARHQVLVDAYEDSGVRVILGRFATRTTRCNARCQEYFDRYEEKETDINIALTMVELGLRRSCEKVILLTGDSDQVASIVFCRRMFPDLCIKALIPPAREAQALKEAAHEHARLGLQHFTRHRFPEEITTTTGRKLVCPEKWRAPVNLSR